MLVFIVSVKCITALDLRDCSGIVYLLAKTGQLHVFYWVVLDVCRVLRRTRGYRRKLGSCSYTNFCF